MEQRLREERRRAAVEEKRKQRLKEEKVSFNGPNPKTFILSEAGDFTAQPL